MLNKNLLKKILSTLLLEKKLTRNGLAGYKSYIAAVIDLGKYYQRFLSKKNASLIRLAEYQLSLAYLEFSRAEKWGRHIVNMAWTGKVIEYLDNETQTLRKQTIASKLTLPESVQEDFAQGMMILNQLYPPCDPEAQYEMSWREFLLQENNKIAEDPQKFEECVEFHLMMACEAIQSYKTVKQKIIRVFSSVLSFLAAIACGILIAVTILCLSHVWWVVVIASLFFCAATYANFKMLNERTYSFFNLLFGKDKFFDGFAFINQFGEKQELSTAKKLSIPVWIFLAASVGMAQAGLIGGAFLLLHHIVGFAFLTVGLAGAICFPIGIILITAALICFTALVFKEMIKIIQEDSVRAALLRPFRELIKKIELIFSTDNPSNIKTPAKILRIGKYVTYGVLGLLAVITVAGLIALSYISAVALVTVFVFLHVSLGIAQAFAFAIGLGLSGPPEALFQISSVAESIKKIVMWIFKEKLLSLPEEREKISQVIHETPESLFDTGISHVSNVINAVGSGGLVGGSLYSQMIQAGAGLVVVIIASVALGFAEFLNNFFPVFSADEVETDEENHRQVVEAFSVSSSTHYKVIIQDLLKSSESEMDSKPPSFSQSVVVEYEKSENNQVSVLISDSEYFPNESQTSKIGMSCSG